MSTQTLLTGLLWQVFWTVIAGVLVWASFRVAVKHYSAVGN
jgi:hypothetical protein